MPADGRWDLTWHLNGYRNAGFVNEWDTLYHQ